ncbi:MAG: hypothetical protein Q9220_004879 [cf. Caloplaca sp. 1 TL-2023]
MTSASTQDLHHRVRAWAQEVQRQSDDGRQPALLPKKTLRATSNGMKLRPRRPSKTLAEISINPHRRKRNHAEAMPAAPKNARGGKAIEPAKKRGRPVGSKGKGKSSAMAEGDDENSSDNEPVSLPSRGRPVSVPDLQPPSDSSAKTPASRQSSSPSKSKRGDKLLNKPRSDKTIDMRFLATCEPAIYKTSFPRLKALGKSISEETLDLRQKLLNIPKALVPGVLKVYPDDVFASQRVDLGINDIQVKYEQDVDTPRKSRDPLPDSEYQDPSETPFTQYQLERLVHTVDEVYRKALLAAETQAHERQWGSIATQILQEAESWPQERNVVLFNVETCSIQPVEFKPIRPDTQLPLDNESDHTSSTVQENLGRMVDWALALQLSDQDLGLINRAFSRSLDHEHSLNQSLSYISDHPIFADIEVKTRSNRDPEVQLAIWAAGAILKRRHHGWKTSIPMPAIVVDGHSWKWYLIFELGDAVVVQQLTGPDYFGDTSTKQGIWTILYRLHLLIEWGSTVFAQWVQDEILDWAKCKIDE